MMVFKEKNALGRIRAELRSDSLTAPPDWLACSYEDPLRFWSGLCGVVEPGQKPRKSISMKVYDFYHDMLACHPAESRPAFRWYDETGGKWQNLSRRDLKELADLQAESWAFSGIGEGSHMCLIHPMGPDLAVNLVAALKMGLVISMLPPHGDWFLSGRLAVLNPDFIDTAPELQFFLKAFRDKFPRLPPDSVTGEQPLRSSVYESGKTLFIIFDPSSDQPALPVAVTCDTGYLCPLRDGLISLGLLPGQSVAAPGFHDQQVQPWLLLASLLCGLTYVHISLESLEKKPELLDDSPIDALGVSSGLRGLALRFHDCIRGPFHTWFRCPDDSPDPEAWQAFSRLGCMEGSRWAALKWKASLAGCELFSPLRSDSGPVRVFPAAGLSFQLEPPPFTGDGVPGSYGCPVVNGPGIDVSTTSLLGLSEKGWNYLGPWVRGNKGRTFSTDEVLGFLESEGMTVSITLIQAWGICWGMRVILMVFSPEQAGDKRSGKMIRDLIARRLAPEFIPDAVYIYPLLPPLLEDGTVDHDWCRHQFVSGQLKEKSCNELDLCYSALRHQLRTGSAISE